MATSEAQKRASKAWAERNRERASRNSARRAARAFIRHHSTQEDLDELKQLILEREQQLREEPQETDSEKDESK